MLAAVPAHDATSIKPPIKLTKPVVILGVSIASKEELIGLVDKIESGTLDDVISGLTIDERQAAYALVLELARGFDYVNSDSDTSSEEPVRVTPGMVSHIDEIIQSVSIQNKPSSYVGAAEGSTPEPSKTKANFRSLSSENLCEGVNCSIPRKVVETGKYGLTRIMMNSKGFFFFQFKTLKGLEDVLENGTWMIRNNLIILKKLSMNTRLCKEELTRIPMWVKIHDVPIQGRSSFARCLIEINANDVLKESLTIGVPLIEGSGDHCPKKVWIPPIVDTPIVEETNDGFQMSKATANVPKKGDTYAGNASKSGLSKVSSLLKNQPLKAIVPPTKECNITMSNSYAALDDESEEDVENV
ncbi:zinc knuckle CX2CX4HX4C containing protein [Tanacetum coccineum]|uniref:Zinc knuckle CX2CX4HX4C containing protein n=1 Tax=Tanacetum coccineum TaxID=301880 RepID=A0ABQ4ZGM1_9ASTR